MFGRLSDKVTCLAGIHDASPTVTTLTLLDEVRKIQGSDEVPRALRSLPASETESISATSKSVNGVVNH